MIDAIGYRRQLRELYDAIDAERPVMMKDGPLAKAYSRAGNMLRSSDPPRECPYCRQGIEREKFNSRYFHELEGGATVVCSKE